MKYKPTIVTAYYATHGIPAPEYEYRFHPVRKWRFDMAWPDYMVALEVEGGVHVRGRHTRGAGMVKDMEKYNHAIMCGGWFVLRCTPRDVCMLETAEMVKKVLAIRTYFIGLADLDAAIAQSCAGEPPTDWGGAISSSELTARIGHSPGGTFWRRLVRLAAGGEVRHGKYRRAGKRKAMLYSVADVTACIKGGELG